MARIIVERYCLFVGGRFNRSSLSHIHVISSRRYSVKKPIVKMVDDLKLCDPTQVLLLKEPCIAVDCNDIVVGTISKEQAHLLGPKKQLPPLHRAFSVFLFNSKNELFMQQRSKFKITFPGNSFNLSCLSHLVSEIFMIWLTGYFTNACCSHPLYCPEEMEEGEDHIGKTSFFTKYKLVQQNNVFAHYY